MSLLKSVAKGLFYGVGMAVLYFAFLALLVGIRGRAILAPLHLTLAQLALVTLVLGASLGLLGGLLSPLVARYSVGFILMGSLNGMLVIGAFAVVTRQSSLGRSIIPFLMIGGFLGATVASRVLDKKALNSQSKEAS